MYAHEQGKIPVSPDTSHPRFPGKFLLTVKFHAVLLVRYSEKHSVTLF